MREIILIMLIGASLNSYGQTKKKKVKYKSHTQIDFTGEKIEGKVKTPAVFYIFQRKRSKGHSVASAPTNLDFNDTETKKVLYKALVE